MTRWNEDPAYPNPFSPVQRARKFSAVCNKRQTLSVSNRESGGGAKSERRNNTYLGDNVGTEFHDDTSGGLSANSDIKVNTRKRPVAKPVPRVRNRLGEDGKPDEPIVTTNGSNSLGGNLRPEAFYRLQRRCSGKSLCDSINDLNKTLLTLYGIRFERFCTRLPIQRESDRTLPRDERTGRCGGCQRRGYPTEVTQDQNPRC